MPDEVATPKQGLRLKLGKDGVYTAPHPGGRAQVEALIKRNAVERQERSRK